MDAAIRCYGEYGEEIDERIRRNAEEADRRLALFRQGAVAAKAAGILTGVSDEELLRAAQLDRRTVVTENVGDFIPIAKDHVATGTPHHGLVRVAPSAFARSSERRRHLGRGGHGPRRAARAGSGYDPGAPGSPGCSPDWRAIR